MWSVSCYTENTRRGRGVFLDYTNYRSTFINDDIEFSKNRCDKLSAGKKQCLKQISTSLIIFNFLLPKKKKGIK